MQAKIETIDVSSIQESDSNNEWNWAYGDDDNNYANTITFHENDASSGEEATPHWLVPQVGKYAIEKVIFNTLVMDPPPALPSAKAIDGTDFMIDPLSFLIDEIAFQQTTTGMRLTYQQSWFAHSVTLGHLLHTITLAPGESVRVAMLDWTRRTSATNKDAVAESEQLDNTMAHGRSLGEVTEALATEAQEGFSRFSSHSSTTSSGGSSGGSFFGFFGGGGSHSSSSSSSHATGYTQSTGSRDFSASLSQHIMDRAQQHASNARNRRATVIKEIHQNEKKSATTRIITNYNHMHALTIQYYEMMQVYRTELQLVGAEYCLYVPISQLNFEKNPALITLFRYHLSAFALDKQIGDKILNGNLDLFKADKDLLNHLSKNANHYNAVIIKSLDTAQIIKLLSLYSYGKGKEKRPLLELVDLNPLAIIDNLLVFSLGAIRQGQKIETPIQRKQKEWLEERGFDFQAKQERFIALPSGGIHAEAVLGVNNCAEKLDITRFWNWQESPIPILPTDINPVSLASRAQHTELKTEHFHDSGIHLAAPSTLPQPTGMQAALSAVSQGNTFRNMSAANETVNLAQTGIQQASQSAQHAATQANKNTTTAVQTQTGIVKEVAPLVVGAMGGGATGGGGAGGMPSSNSLSGMTKAPSLSTEGASLNLAKQLDIGKLSGSTLQNTFNRTLGGNTDIIRPLIENSILKPPAQTKSREERDNIPGSSKTASNSRR